MARRLSSDGHALWNPVASLGVVFAHTDPDAWATLIEGYSLGSGLIPRRIMANRHRDAE